MAPIGILALLMIEKVKILIVEYEIVLGLDLYQRLTQLGYEVLRVTKNPEKAMITLGNDHPDILILYIKLGNSKTDGIDLSTRYENFTACLLFSLLLIKLMTLYKERKRSNLQLISSSPLTAKK